MQVEEGQELTCRLNDCPARVVRVAQAESGGIKEVDVPIYPVPTSRLVLRPSGPTRGPAVREVTAGSVEFECGIVPVIPTILVSVFVCHLIVGDKLFVPDTCVGSQSIQPQLDRECKSLRRRGRLDEPM